MANRYADLFFGPETRARQAQVNSDIAYADGGDHDGGERMPLAPAHRGLIEKQRHFFLGSVTPSGWPYVQHRGGPAGFVHVLDPLTLGFADFEGNEQFVSAGNLDHDGRVALFFVDYPTRTRLKVFGRARMIDADTGDDADRDLHECLLTIPDGRIKSPSTRSVVIDVEAFDMNCRKYIQPRYEREAVDAMIAPYRDDLRATKAELDAAKARIAELEAQLRDPS